MGLEGRCSISSANGDVGWFLDINVSLVINDYANKDMKVRLEMFSSILYSQYSIIKINLNPGKSVTESCFVGWLLRIPPHFGGHNFPPSRLKFGMELKCLWGCVYESISMWMQLM